jgi:hypothetical protein
VTPDREALEQAKDKLRHLASLTGESAEAIRALLDSHERLERELAESEEDTVRAETREEILEAKLAAAERELERAQAAVIEGHRVLTLFRSYYLTDNLLGKIDPKTNMELTHAHTTLEMLARASRKP